MLRVSIHAGLLKERNPQNQVGAVDIAYHKRAALADYVVAMQLNGRGELEPGFVRNYPRWAGSIWDLVARAIAAVLYADQNGVAPPVPRIDKRCAYSTKMCAVVQAMAEDGRGSEIGTVELLQPGRARGSYVATFQEDILGPRTAEFDYGCKILNPADLLLRAICYAHWGMDILGTRPGLILPATMKVDGTEVFDLQALDEPARTGFSRHRANSIPLAKPEPMPKAQDYANFLMRG